MKFAKFNIITAATVIAVLINLSLIAYFMMDLKEKSFLFGGHAKPAYIMDQAIVPAGDFDTLTEEEALTRYAVYLEWKLVKVEKDGNFIIETYQEFEVYKDGKETVKISATPNFQYLRYWDE